MGGGGLGSFLHKGGRTTWAARLSPPSFPAGEATVRSIPAAGSQTASPQTSISITGAPPSAIGAISVSGSVSGVIAGTTRALPDGLGLEFDPTNELAPGETITATSAIAVSGGSDGRFSFEVGHPIAVARGWHPVAEVACLGTMPIARTLLDVPLVVYRGSEGPRVLRDRCPHRGMALSRGRVADDAIVCPCHGWRFGVDGRCTGVPGARTVPDVAAEALPSQVRASPLQAQ